MAQQNDQETGQPIRDLPQPDGELGEAEATATRGGAISRTLDLRDERRPRFGTNPDGAPVPCAPQLPCDAQVPCAP